jgi:hypothetical protein
MGDVKLLRWMGPDTAGQSHLGNVGVFDAVKIGGETQ